MDYTLKYLGRSEIDQGPYRSSVRFAPNLSRERVYFDGELKDPTRFREAMSALHEVVMGDLRIKKKDKSAYEAWKAREAAEEQALRVTLLDKARVQAAQEIANQPIPPNLDRDFREQHRKYWQARVRWANELMRNDPALFRSLVPCDPVISVADDSVYFEAFSKDESSYGCLYVDRNAFDGGQDAALGTTNVDYSLALYERFQQLRSYRTTRLSIDPRGFDVKLEGAANFREEKIDLPPSWLKGFGQISATSSFPTRTAQLDVGALYSVLAFLRRHREKTGPRSIIFELRPGKPVTLLLEPFGIRIQSSGAAYKGEREENIKVWGRRRLSVLARLLPLVDHCDVQLLGSGLPSIWSVKMGELRFVLGLSGWTANDWTRGTGLDLLQGAFSKDDSLRNKLWEHLRMHRLATLDELSAEMRRKPADITSSLHRLSREGQVLFDNGAGAYRFRQVIDVADALRVATDEPEEFTKGKELFLGARVDVTSRDEVQAGKLVLAAKVADATCEAVVDGDGVMTRARCDCHYFFKNGLRRGPCRHLLALRLTAHGGDALRFEQGSIGGGFIH